MTTKRAYGRAQLDRTALADDGPLTFVASSTAPNRYGFSLRNDGWRLDNFNANPVVLWMHNPFQPPIGRGMALSKNDQIILDQVTFDTEDQLARAVESKYRRGFLSAVSVGWGYVKEDGSPITNWWRLSNDEIRDEAFYDLEEVSAVTVPGDPRAVVAQSRLVLARLSHELADAYDEQDHGTEQADTVRAVVAAELQRLGIALPPTPSPAPAGDVPPTIDQAAAASVLAAFAPILEGLAT